MIYVVGRRLIPEAQQKQTPKGAHYATFGLMVGFIIMMILDVALGGWGENEKSSEEDYIKAIYELTVERNIELIKTNELSERFNYTDQSVNEMIKRLDEKKLVAFLSISWGWTHTKR